jgi:hypothetical protein
MRTRKLLAALAALAFSASLAQPVLAASQHKKPRAHHASHMAKGKHHAHHGKKHVHKAARAKPKTAS